jgi:ABC-type amino acid transport substrate-binding protein
MKKKSLNKLFGVVLAVTIAVASVACAKKSDDKAANSLEKIKKAGKLVVGSSVDYPPYEFYNTKDGKNEIVGFDMDIAKEIAKDLGVEIEIKDMDFDGLLAALSADKVDMVIAGMTPDEERKKSADFSKLYYMATHGVVMRKGEEGTVKSLSDLNGKVVGVQQGSVQDKIAEAEIKDAKEIKKVGKITDLVLMLQSGKVDAIVMELPVANSYVKTNDKLALTSVEVKDEQGGSAVAVKKNSPELVEQVNKTIDRLLKDNKVSEFFAEANKLAEEQQEEKK